MKVLKILISVTSALMLLGILVSCGENANGVAGFKTVNATATVDSSKNPLLADLATWSGDPCKFDAGSTFSILDDNVIVTVKSTPNITSGTSLPLILESVSISFSPADSISPPLPPILSPIFQNLNGTILEAGTSLPIPVEVITHRMKEYFGTTLVCQEFSPIYSYNATITFNAVEQGTGVTGSMSAGLTVRFADFAD
jgi:hypothetical protein